MEKFTNARVHEWLTPELESVTRSMHTTRLQVNSAALWWFCCHLSAEQRAVILGEYVKVQAMGGKEPTTNTIPQPQLPTPEPLPKPRRRGRPRKVADSA